MSILLTIQAGSLNDRSGLVVYPQPYPPDPVRCGVSNSASCVVFLVLVTFLALASGSVPGGVPGLGEGVSSLPEKGGQQSIISLGRILTPPP